jgi:hypothetical protein
MLIAAELDGRKMGPNQRATPFKESQRERWLLIPHFGAAS